jgi:hypothetical protein
MNKATFKNVVNLILTAKGSAEWAILIKFMRIINIKLNYVQQKL